MIANDAATLPASLRGVHLQTGIEVEVRLAARASLAPDDVCASTRSYSAQATIGRELKIARCRHRSHRADGFAFGSLTAVIEGLLGHPRLDRAALRELQRGGLGRRSLATAARFSTRTCQSHCSCGMSGLRSLRSLLPTSRRPPDSRSIGSCLLLRSESHRVCDDHPRGGHLVDRRSELDQLLPFDEPYRIPVATEQALRRACREGRRAVAIGTTVVRALEHSAARFGAVVAGDGVADQRIGAHTPLRVVDAILSGTHEPGTSHYALLHAFADASVLRCADRALDADGFRTHEFGDSVLIERASEKYSSEVRRCDADVIFVSNARTGRAGRSPYTSRFLRAAHVVQEPGRLSPAGRLVGCSC